jgi:glutaconyl-CoA/methylmalonyl-CoA decarboxylase subunit gamma
MKKLRITVEGKVYEVQVEILDEPEAAPRAAVPAGVGGASVAAPAATPRPAAPANVAPGDVLSPLAGKVVTVHVAAGQAVKEGQELVTLEAMKMNTFIYAPKDGTVGKVAITAGDAVEENQLLLTVE